MSGRNQAPGSLNGRVPVQLNSLFKLQDTLANTTYRLAHVSVLSVVGSPMPCGPEGMIRISTPIKNHVIGITGIEGMAHLILVDPGKLYLINNRIDVHTWNNIHDGN